MTKTPTSFPFFAYAKENGLAYGDVVLVAQLIKTAGEVGSIAYAVATGPVRRAVDRLPKEAIPEIGDLVHAENARRGLAGARKDVQR